MSVKQKKKILVTGAAGFIGFHLCNKLLDLNLDVVGVDDLNDYYDVKLKKNRLKILLRKKNFKFRKIDLKNSKKVTEIFNRYKFARVFHLAAQAGVRYSLENPAAYIDSNIVGFANLLESCRMHKMPHLIFASSSSVYGANTKMPFSSHQNVDHPISLYAATKKSNELMAHVYSHLFRIPVTGLRFFTVYGPWGRPDMSYFIFAKAIMNGKSINVFNQGKMQRDFTYVDDIVNGLVQVMDRIPEPDPNWDAADPDPASSSAPYRIYNIGNNRPVELLDFIRVLEGLLGKKAQLKFLPMQPGDVVATFADIDDLYQATGFKPTTSIEDGLMHFVKWYKDYYRG